MATTEKKYWNMNPTGKERMEELNLSVVEITAIQMALDGSLDKESNKRGKITKAALSSLLQKIIPETKWFTISTSANEEDRIAEEKALKEALEATVRDKPTGDKKEEEKPVCKFFDAGKCTPRKGQTCENPHPPTCKAFDRKGKEGCKEEPCPRGKHHRRVCEKFTKGNCPYDDKCRLYHPPKLGKEIETQKKKKQEEEEALKNEKEAFLGKLAELERKVSSLTQELLEAREAERRARTQAPMQMPYPMPYYNQFQQLQPVAAAPQMLPVPQLQMQQLQLQQQQLQQQLQPQQQQGMWPQQHFQR